MYGDPFWDGLGLNCEVSIFSLYGKFWFCFRLSSDILFKWLVTHSMKAAKGAYTIECFLFLPDLRSTL